MPGVLQARLAYLAHKSPIWTDLAACVTGLRGRSALLIRQQRSMSTGSPTFLVLFVTPPDGLAVKSVHLDGPQSGRLENLAAATPEALSRVDPERLQRLAVEFLPRSLLERAGRGELASLVVVPDGAAWTRSVAGYGRTGRHRRDPGAVAGRARPDPRRPARGRVDHRGHRRGRPLRRGRGGRTAGRARQRVRRPPPAQPRRGTGGDLLVTFTHGSGTGLGFTAGNAERPLPALVLAATRFRSVLAAACWSSAAPPTAYPLNLPAALLLNGASTVAGGLWPLPAADTAAIVAAVVADIAGGTGLRAAIRRARSKAPPAVMSRWGLAVHGGPASP
jgi:hypothetical protein